MKIFLCGGGDGKQTIEAYKRLNEIIEHKKPLLYIPFAMENDIYEDCYKWIINELKDINIPNIEMITSAEQVAQRDLNKYCAIFIGGGNTFKLLNNLKVSGVFEKISEYINNDGVVFGGSAGAIIFGKNLKSCKLDDDNDVGLQDISGFDVLNGYSLLCHYTNRTKEKDEESKKYLIELSAEEKIIALPEEDTIFVNNDKIEIIGNKPYFEFINGSIIEHPIIYLKTPDISELHYRQNWMKDSETMKYNAGYDIELKGYDKKTGIIIKTDEEMVSWYKNWINKEPDKYFAYVYSKGIDEPIGEVYYYLSENIHSMGIVIQDKYRGKGFSYYALLELEKVAFEKNGITELSDMIPINRIGAVNAFKKAGFVETNLEKIEKVFDEPTIVRQLLITREMYNISNKMDI